MAEATVFVDRETGEPCVVDLDQDSGLCVDGDDETITWREALDDLDTQNVHVVSEWSLMAAVWALQQIEAGADPKATARAALNELAMGGDLEERTEFVDEADRLFSVQPITRAAGQFESGPGSYEWASALDEQRPTDENQEL